MNIQHPEISWIEATGYPSWKQDEPTVMCCEKCGDELYLEEGEVYEDTDYGYDCLCSHCLLALHRKEIDS
jgi:hypothetical protein